MKKRPSEEGRFVRSGPAQEAEGLAAGLADGAVLAGADGTVLVVGDGLLVVELHAPSARVALNRSRAKRDFTGGVLQ